MPFSGTEQFVVDVVFLAGGTMQLTASDADEVKDLTSRLGLGCSARLLFCGSELPHGRSLKSLGVGPTREGSPCIYCLEADGRSETGKSHMLTIVNLFGGHIHLPARERDTISGLKQALAEHFSGALRLLFRGEELQDALTLGHYGISTGKTIYLLEATGRAVADEPEEETLGPQVERRIDGLWYPAQVLKAYSAEDGGQILDIRYLDDGNVERGVEMSECRISQAN